MDRFKFIQFIQAAADDIPTPPKGKAHLFVDTSGGLSVKLATGAVLIIGEAQPVRVGDTITGDPGTDASVEVNAAGELVFTIPRGDPGP